MNCDVGEVTERLENEQSWDLHPRYPVLRTDVLPFNHGDTDTKSESNLPLILQPKTLRM